LAPDFFSQTMLRFLAISLLVATVSCGLRSRGGWSFSPATSNPTMISPWMLMMSAKGGNDDDYDDPDATPPWLLMRATKGGDDDYNDPDAMPPPRRLMMRSARGGDDDYDDPDAVPPPSRRMKLA